jgi:post-segregation antitoxin (ccd killing protein)
MGKYVTVSVKIPIELKEKMKQLSIKPSTLLRKAIEEEVKKREIQKIKAQIKELKPLLNKISIKEIVQGIREDREQR